MAFNSGLGDSLCTYNPICTLAPLYRPTIRFTTAVDVILPTVAVGCVHYIILYCSERIIKNNNNNNNVIHARGSADKSYAYS